MRIDKWNGGRHFALWDDEEELVCVTVYKVGAEEVKRRLEEQDRRRGSLELAVSEIVKKPAGEMTVMDYLTICSAAKTASGKGDAPPVGR